MGNSKRAAVIFYPGRVDRRKLQAAIQQTTMPLGWEPTLWFKTSEAETGGVQVQRALAQKATHILVAGGDGTVREVLDALAHIDTAASKKVTVGIIPIGTGNVLARNLRVDLHDLKLAVQRGLLGNRHPLDLGLARIIFADGKRAEMHFAVMAGVGLDAKIMQNTNEKLKRAIGWVAYLDGGIKALPSLFERMDVSVDGREARTLKLVSLLIGNAGWLPGNISLMPDARLDDGLLDVAAVGPRRFWNWIDFWGRVTWGNRVIRPNRMGRQLMDATANVKTLENLSGAKIRVIPERPVHMQLDGDPLGLIAEVEFEVQPRAVTFRV